MSLFTLLAVILAALSYKNVMLSAFFFVAMVAMYITLYTRMTRFGWNKPKRSKMSRAHARSNAQRTGRHQPPATSLDSTRAGNPRLRAPQSFQA